MEVSVPLATEKASTPMSMMRMQYTFSMAVPPEMSPYPTVVIVVMVK